MFRYMPTKIISAQYLLALSDFSQVKVLGDNGISVFIQNFMKNLKLLQISSMPDLSFWAIFFVVPLSALPTVKREKWKNAYIILKRLQSASGSYFFFLQCLALLFIDINRSICDKHTRASSSKQENVSSILLLPAPSSHMFVIIIAEKKERQHGS